ncbi:hypothetical protein Bhyg_04263 [Pseudolycoriella hygida]|uniref:Uncharacterized protein n=1 Tax=Pseudolycoriella hygida TaxID=35572 RepID=A0A9Q0NF02_9DIPT|nr:hypothetical protein Bhyg_04263 [Pseudolycoriella hygida]
MSAQYFFLCECHNKREHVYAIRSSATDWHYFEEQDCLLNIHISLPAELGRQILSLKEIQEILVYLDPDQIVHYVANGKFIFKGKELKTYIELAGKQTDQSEPTRKSVLKSTYGLVFVEGKSNPAVFLKEFEKCEDAKTKDKLFKIRNFVKLEDKQTFSKLYFTSDWSTAKSIFLKKYSLAFTTNKKAQLDFTFDQEASLRSFVLRKMKALSTYTSLSLQNQLEIILNELPVEISNLFIVHDKMNCTKADILEFCDSIQEIIEDKYDEPDNNVTLTVDPVERNRVMQDLEECNCVSETASEIDSSGHS